jgi:hypothetical protein
LDCCQELFTPHYAEASDIPSVTNRLHHAPLTVYPIVNSKERLSYSPVHNGGRINNYFIARDYPTTKIGQRYSPQFIHNQTLVNAAEAACRESPPIKFELTYNIRS